MFTKAHEYPARFVGIVIVSLFVFVVSAHARIRSGSKYDVYSGNSYHWNQSGKQVTVRGNNLRTGNMWNTTIDNNTGNMRGTDARGNYWNYNSQSGYYYNSDGTTCFGRGALRTCN